MGDAERRRKKKRKRNQMNEDYDFDDDSYGHSDDSDVTISNNSNGDDLDEADDENTKFRAKKFMKKWIVRRLAYPDPEVNKGEFKKLCKAKNRSHFVNFYKEFAEEWNANGPTKRDFYFVGHGNNGFKLINVKSPRKKSRNSNSEKPKKPKSNKSKVPKKGRMNALQRKKLQLEKLKNSKLRCQRVQTLSYRILKMVIKISMMMTFKRRVFWIKMIKKISNKMQKRMSKKLNKMKKNKQQNGEEKEQQ